MKPWAWTLVAVIAGLAAVPVGAFGLGALFVPAVRSTPLVPPLGQALGEDRWHQVQIEQHLTIRITPGNPAVLRDLPPPAPQPLPERLRVTRELPCLPVAAIAGVRPLSNNRLLLILRDHRLIGADLSRNCTARDFYLGFYVTPNNDGLLCAGRDMIHSRAGTTCTISEVHLLVPTN